MRSGPLVRCVPVRGSLSSRSFSMLSPQGLAVHASPLLPRCRWYRHPGKFGPIIGRFNSTAVSGQVASAGEKQQEPTVGPSTSPRNGLIFDDLIITVGAARRINEIRSKQAVPGDGLSYFQLRVKVEGGGCSGFKYEFAFEQAETAADDIVFERNGARVVTDTVSLDLIRGSTVEWDDSMMRSAFAITNNPNAESSCGCKSSFAPKAPS